MVIAADPERGYDLEYDDDEIEESMSQKCVREVKKPSFEERMARRAKRMEEEAEEKAKAEKEAEEKAKAEKEAEEKAKAEKEAEEKAKAEEETKKILTKDDAAEIFKHPHSKIDAPLLSDAVDYAVEIDSHEPDALEGDAFRHHPCRECGEGHGDSLVRGGRGCAA